MTFCFFQKPVRYPAENSALVCDVYNYHHANEKNNYVKINKIYKIIRVNRPMTFVLREQAQKKRKNRTNHCDRNFGYFFQRNKYISYHQNHCGNSQCIGMNPGEDIFHNKILSIL